MDSNGPSVRWSAILTILEAEMGSSQNIELLSSSLTFPTPWIFLELEFYNSRYSYKSEERSDSNSSKMDSNDPSVCWWAILTILEAELGSSQNIQLVASCLTFPTPKMSLESEFYNSRYSYKSEERSDSNSSKMDSNFWTVTVQVFVYEWFWLY